MQKKLYGNGSSNASYLAELLKLPDQLGLKHRYVITCIGFIGVSLHTHDLISTTVVPNSCWSQGKEEHSYPTHLRDVIRYLCPYVNATLTNLCYQKRPLAYDQRFWSIKSPKVNRTRKQRWWQRWQGWRWWWRWRKNSHCCNRKS